MTQWKGYPLFAEEIDDTGDIPRGCRLDDGTLAFLVDKYTDRKKLHTQWPTEIDSNGMIKARRMPLGFAAKMYVQVGDIDRNGHPATQAGWYYKWYRGLHLLCGLEGQEDYKHRPNWERELSNTWYFDQNFRCVFQEKEHGPLAREQFDSVIGTKAVDVDLPVQVLSSVDSDDSDLNISDPLQVNPLRHQLARAIERTEARAEKRKGAFTESDSQVLSDGGNGSNNDNGGSSLPNAKRTKTTTEGVKGTGKKTMVTEARAKKQ